MSQQLIQQLMCQQLKSQTQKHLNLNNQEKSKRYRRHVKKILTEFLKGNHQRKNSKRMYYDYEIRNGRERKRISIKSNLKNTDDIQNHLNLGKIFQNIPLIINKVQVHQILKLYFTNNHGERNHKYKIVSDWSYNLKPDSKNEEPYFRKT